VESNEAEIARMIAAGIVEGVGPRSGRIDVLRIICTEIEAITRLAALRQTECIETAGTITSQASREIYREPLADGHKVWAFKRQSNRQQSSPAQCRGNVVALPMAA
jgi:hypothetical protein